MNLSNYVRGQDPVGVDYRVILLDILWEVIAKQTMQNGKIEEIRNYPMQINSPYEYLWKDNDFCYRFSIKDNTLKIQSWIRTENGWEDMNDSGDENHENKQR